MLYLSSNIESDRIRVYVRVRPRTLEESKRQEELGVEYDKFEVSSSKVEIDSVITASVFLIPLFFTLIYAIIISILYFRVDLSYSKGIF